jgi:hypothetical protein
LCARPGRRRIGARGEGGKGLQAMEKEHKACEARYQSLSAEASALRQVSGRGCLRLHRPAARGHDVLHVARHPHVACVRACARPDRTCRTLRRVCAAQEKEAKIRNLQQRYAREQVGTPYAAPMPHRFPSGNAPAHVRAQMRATPPHGRRPALVEGYADGVLTRGGMGHSFGLALRHRSSARRPRRTSRSGGPTSTLRAPRTPRRSAASRCFRPASLRLSAAALALPFRLALSAAPADRSIGVLPPHRLSLLLAAPCLCVLAAGGPDQPGTRSGVEYRPNHRCRMSSTKRSARPTCCAQASPSSARRSTRSVGLFGPFPIPYSNRRGLTPTAHPNRRARRADSSDAADRPPLRLLSSACLATRAHVGSRFRPPHSPSECQPGAHAAEAERR